MEVHEVDLGLVEPVAVPGFATDGASALEGAVLSGSLGVQTAVHETHTDNRGQPLTYSYIECGRDALAKLALLVMVAEKHLRAGSG